MAWEEVTRISNAWQGELGYIWEADLVLQINIKSVNESTRVVTYDLRMLCVKTGGTANSATSTDNELWIGPSENVPLNKDTAGNYRSGKYYKRVAGTQTWTNNDSIFEVDDLTDTYNSDGTLSKGLAIAAWTGTFTFIQNRTTYNFPVQSFGGRLSVKTSDGWQKSKGVWVKTSDGWQKAKGIWVKTSDGWKEAK